MAGGTTLPRRALGRRMRELRAAAQKSQLAAGLAIEVSKQGIGRLEEGQVVRISTAQFRDLLDFYSADEDTKAEVLGLIQEIRAAKKDTTTGWWRAYDDVVKPHFDHFMSLEQACSRMTSFQLTLLPGLLQTAAYRRWIMNTADPDISAEESERHLELLASRQRKLSEGTDFMLELLLSESSLRHQVGGGEVMIEQLDHLSEAGSRPNLSVRAIPFGAGAHPGLLIQSFTLFEFPELSSGRILEPPVVFVDGFTGALFIEDDVLIDRYSSAVQTLRQVALSEDDTRCLLRQIAEEHASD
ncbi:helix-turn-helix domain-containing protein [Nocardia nova]|uniref:helix-turn-helix domain-containing protein n=1 Tax=Nocardia nova TaxID=37330 RepID=UPI0033CD2A74